MSIKCILSKQVTKNKQNLNCKKYFGMLTQIIVMHSTKIIFKTISFICIFTFLFLFLHATNPFSVTLLEKNLSATPWLYSTLGLIFSVISGFIIQHKWHMWDNLIDASQNEISSFRQLLLVARHYKTSSSEEIQKEIRLYLISLIHEGWKNIDRGIRSNETENALSELENTIFIASQKMPNLRVFSLNVLSKITESREQRLHNSSRHLPFPLRAFLLCVITLIIFLSFFIPIENLLLDYIFKISVALPMIGIYMLIDDLDHPYRPGNWHLTTKDYQTLLQEIEIIPKIN